MHSDLKNIRTLFIQNRTASAPREDTLYFPEYTESLIPGILQKTVSAFEHVLKTEDFDFVLRTNLSSFYVFP